MLPPICTTTQPVFPPYRGPFESRMVEWSYVRSGSAQINPVKFRAGRVNAAHEAFRKGDLDLSGLVDAVFTFLHDHRLHTGLLAFLDGNLDRFGAENFCLKSSRFGAALSKAWEDWARNNASTETAPEPAAGSAQEVAPVPRNVLGRASYAELKQALPAAIVRLRQGADDAEDCLYRAALQFFLAKARHHLQDSPGGHHQPEDVAQYSALYTCQNISKFRGDPSSFYSWLNQICYSKSLDAIASNRADAARFVPLFVESDEEPGLMMDNPLIQTESPLDTIMIIPRCIKGKDRLICSHIRAGLTYAQIGKVMHISEGAVKQRLSAMRKRMEKPQ